MSVPTGPAGQVGAVWSGHIPSLPKARLFPLVRMPSATQPAASGLLATPSWPCLHRITGREYSAESREATTTFDIIGKLRARRLQWLGHMLRASKDRLIHVAVAQMIDHRQDGDLLSDAPAHDGSIEKLIELAEDRDEWRKRVHKLAPKKKVNKRAASTEEEEYKNHKQDMPWADSQKSQKHMYVGEK